LQMVQTTAKPESATYYASKRQSVGTDAGGQLQNYGSRLGSNTGGGMSELSYSISDNGTMMNGGGQQQ